MNVSNLPTNLAENLMSPHAKFKFNLFNTCSAAFSSVIYFLTPDLTPFRAVHVWNFPIIRCYLFNNYMVLKKFIYDAQN